MTEHIQNWLSELDTGLRDLAADDRRRALHTGRVLPGHRIQFGDRVYLNLASNDYLGLGGDLGLQREFAQSLAGEHTLERVSFTASASRLLGGEHPALAVLENVLADAYGHGRRAVVFGSGYHANIGILPALAKRDDLIVSDRLVHASLVDGIRLSRARWLRYRHNDMEHLENLVASKISQARRVFIVTESLFSMDGDVADLLALSNLKQKYGVILYVDEAHAVGVRGERGLGLAAEKGLLDAVDILVGTFGKALAAFGAYAIVAPVLRDHLINTARSLIFTTAMPPVMAWWTIHALQKALDADDRRRGLDERIAIFRHALKYKGDRSQIVPFVVGDNATATRLSQQLRKRGYWVPPVRPPTVPEGTARLRFSLGADMELDQLSRLAAETLKLAEN